MTTVIADRMCPKCGIKMKNEGQSMTSNAIFVNYKCGTCSFGETKCVGMLPEKQRY